MLSINVTSVTPNEFRVNGTTVYANYTVALARPDGVAIEPRAQHWQLDLAKYPDMKAHVDALLPMLTNAYLFEAQMQADPLQNYTPPAPGGLATTVTTTTATLSWTATAGATSYKVYRSTDGGVTWSAAVAVATGTSHQFTGLTANTEYVLAVTAVGSGGEGPKATIVARTQV